MKTLLAIAALIVAYFLLTGCASDPTVVTKNVYIPVKVNPEFLDENKCPFPRKADYIRTGTDLEVSDWFLAGYQAWLCEHMTRAKIKETSEEQAADIEQRNTSDSK